MKHSLLPLLALLGFFSMCNAQCPAPPTCTITISDNSASNLLVGPNQTVCLTKGSFTGSVSNFHPTGKIYVAPGANFQPVAISNFSGQLINCGNAILPPLSISGTDTVRIENYGKAYFSTLSFNSANKWTNGIGASLFFDQNVTLQNSYLVNNGTIVAKATLTTNGNTILIVNNDSLLVEGDATINGIIENNGLLFNKGTSLTINTQKGTRNNCVVQVNGSLAFNANDTILNNGLLKLGDQSPSTFSINGSAKLYGTTESFVQGSDFINNGSILGFGNYYFSGNTHNQGPFGVDKKGINFYDSSPSGNRFFDNVVMTPDASVTKHPITPRDSTFVPNGCSQIIKSQLCIKPNAYGDIVLCGSSEIKLVTASPKQKWAFVNGPAQATISPFTGQVTGLNVEGNYSFSLTDTIGKCSDTVIVGKVIPPSKSNQVTAVSPICSGGFSILTIQNSELGTIYTPYVGSTPVGSALTGTGATLSKLIQDFIPGKNIVEIRAQKKGCTDTLYQKPIVVVNTPPRIDLQVIGDTLFQSQGSAVVTIKNAEIGVAYQLFEGTSAISPPSVAGGAYLKITVSIFSLGNHTVTATASIHGCGTVQLSSTANVLVQKDISVGLETADHVARFEVGPNPTSSEVMIRNRTHESASFRLLDVLGNLLIEDLLPASDLKTVTLTSQQKGIYLLVVQSQEKEERIKIVKQ